MSLLHFVLSLLAGLAASARPQLAAPEFEFLSGQTARPASYSSEYVERNSYSFKADWKGLLASASAELKKNGYRRLPDPENVDVAFVRGERFDSHSGYRDSVTMIKDRRLAADGAKQASKGWVTIHVFRPSKTDRPTDEAVMEAVLLDFLQGEGADLSRPRGKRDFVTLERYSPDKVGMAMPDQVNQYLKKHKVPQEMVETLYRINKGKSGFDARRTDFGIYAFDRRIKVEKAPPENPFHTISERPSMTSYAPAYSKDRNSAVVRAWIGPSSHGAIATYFLQREKGIWRVEWREFAFFV